jgi:hypothetical protein
LNSLPLSETVLTLFKQAKTSPEPGCLALVALVLWALEDDPEVDPEWAEVVRGSTLLAQRDDPQATYWNLQDSPGVATALTLHEAGQAMLRSLADMIQV